MREVASSNFNCLSNFSKKCQTLKEKYFTDELMYAHYAKDVSNSIITNTITVASGPQYHILEDIRNDSGILGKKLNVNIDSTELTR